MPTDAHAQYREHLQNLTHRADKALQRGRFEHLLIPAGNAHVQVFDDIEYPFAVNPHFKTWVPVTQAPGSWIVYTPGQRPKLLFVQPKDYWHATPAAPSGEWVEHFDIEIIREPSAAKAHLPKEASRCAILGEPAASLGDYVPNNPQAVIDYLDYHRAVKTPWEISQMRQANRIAARAHRAAERAFRAGAGEFGIHLAYCMAAGQDATELPYSSIVALNENAAILHYTDRGRFPPPEVRSFLIDAGASHNGYAADITRSYAQEDDEFAALIQAVDKVQQSLCEKVSDGVDFRELHLQAHRELGGVLHEAGILKVSVDEALEKGITSTFFPHGLGHLIGLQVHDVGGLSASDAGGRVARPEGHPYLRMTRRLQNGMVVTIEPGIYFIDMLLEQLNSRGLGTSVDWHRINHFKPYGGIRIEDDVLCDADGAVNLSREAFAAV